MNFIPVEPELFVPENRVLTINYERGTNHVGFIRVRGLGCAQYNTSERMLHFPVPAVVCMALIEPDPIRKNYLYSNGIAGVDWARTAANRIYYNRLCGEVAVPLWAYEFYEEHPVLVEEWLDFAEREDNA